MASYLGIHHYRDLLWTESPYLGVKGSQVQILSSRQGTSVMGTSVMGTAVVGAAGDGADRRPADFLRG